MKLFFLILLSLSFATVSMADTYVNGYYKKSGTYVKGHYRSDQNDTKSDNWSTKGNVNPYTGQSGTKNNDDESDSSYYGNGLSNSKKKSSLWGR